MVYSKQSRQKLQKMAFSSNVCKVGAHSPVRNHSELFLANYRAWPTSLPFAGTNFANTPIHLPIWHIYDGIKVKGHIPINSSLVTDYNFFQKPYFHIHPPRLEGRSHGFVYIIRLCVWIALPKRNWIFRLCLITISTNERRHHIREVFSYWLRPCSAEAENRPWGILVSHTQEKTLPCFE